MKSRRLWILFFGVTVSPGCYLARPNLYHPGHLLEQQARATVHDPYGDVNLGPEILGARPTNYQVPRSPPTKAQWFLDQVGGF